VNVALYISQKIRFNKGQSFAATVIRIATITIALGMAVMILSVAILKGFRDEIERKIYGLNAHFTINGISESAYELPDIPNAKALAQALEVNPKVKSAVVFAQKPAILKTGSQLQGVLVKGYDLKHLPTGFAQITTANLAKTLADTNLVPILVSTKQANLLQTGVDSVAWLYFLQNPPKFRKVQVVGTFSSGLEDYDNSFIFTDIELIRELNTWPSGTAHGLEVLLHNQDNWIYEAAEIEKELPVELGITPVTQRFAQIFDWLQVIGRNVEILTILIIIVACFNMASTLLLMVLERSPMVGILKTIGANNLQIRNVFLFTGIRILLQGMLIGNAIGFLLAWLQWQFQIIPLDPENYYMSFVPIAWPWTDFLVINLITLTITALSLVLPLVVVNRISPVKAMKFS
jgi:lipoprotein-releasing system permease protein